MKRAKTSVKVAIASALAVSSTAAVIYAAPKIMDSVNLETNKEKIYLDVEKIDNDTVRVSLDNIDDIAKSLQFSIKLDDNVKVKKDQSEKYLISDLLSKEVDARLNNNGYSSTNSIFTDYTYNEDSNTIDVLITAEDSLPKTGNKIEIFELDIEAKSQDSKRKFNITPVVDTYKYVSKDNKEYDDIVVEYDKSSINLNTAPTIEYTGDVINIYDGEKLIFNDIEGIITNDDDNDIVKLKVINITDLQDDNKEDSQPAIEEFMSDEIGTYTFKIYAIDSMGEKSEPINILVNVKYNLNLDPPTIHGGEDVTIQSGTIFKPLDGVSAKDAKGRDLNVTVSGDLDLNPENDTKYVLTYTAVDKYGKTTTKNRTVMVLANKAPVITGIENTVVNVGDEFDPKSGVKVEDDIDTDLNSKLVIEGEVKTSIAGEYKLIYSVTDSGNKTTRAQRIVRVNRTPVITGNDSILVVKTGTQLTKDMILAGINITDETEYSVEVQIPDIKNEGRYEAKITATDKDNGITVVTRTIVVTSGNVVELPNSGQGETQEDMKVIQVVDEAGINTLNKKLSDATKEYSVEMTKKKLNEYTKYNFVISKKEAVFRDANKIYLEVRVPNEIEKSTGGIIITEYAEILATEVKIDNKEKLNHYINKGDEIDLTATIKPDNTTNKKLDWISTNEDVVELLVTENGVKAIAKEYGIATIKVGATDGSEKYDEFTFNVANGFNELPDDIYIVSGDGTQDSPVIYETTNVESLNKLLSNAKDDFKVLLQDKKVLGEDKVKYYLKLEEKSVIAKLFGKATNHYVAFILPNTNEFEDVMYKLEKDDTKAPTLIYNGDREVILENKADFKFPVVTAKDNLDKDITVNNVIKDSKGNKIDSIDTSIAGTYTITYTASDLSGNKSILEIKVIVKEKGTPEKPDSSLDNADGELNQNPENSNSEEDMEKEESPKTGDMYPVGILGLVSSFAALGSVLAYKRKKK